MKRYSLVLGFICFFIPAGVGQADDYQLNVSGVAARQYSDAVQEESERSVLSPDVERTAALRLVHQFRTFVYHGRKDETVTVKVKSVQFAPEVFLRNANDETVVQELNRDGAHEVELKQRLSSEGDYYIRIRAKGAGQGLFQVAVHSEMPNPEQAAPDGSSASSQQGQPSK